MDIERRGENGHSCFTPLLIFRAIDMLNLILLQTKRQVQIMVNI